MRLNPSSSVQHQRRPRKPFWKGWHGMSGSIHQLSVSGLKGPFEILTEPLQKILRRNPEAGGRALTARRTSPPQNSNTCKGNYKMNCQLLNAGNRRGLACGISAMSLLAVLAQTGTAYADISNSAIAVGTYSSADDTSSSPSTQDVPVVPAARDLSVVKTVKTGSPTTALGTDGSNTDAGDTITYVYVITNDGNVTEINVTPVDTGPTFNGTAAENSLGAFTEVSGGTGTAATLAPGQTVHFEAVYTLAALDVYRSAGVTNGVVNSATASSQDHTDTDSSSVTTTVAANPALTIAKVATLNDEVTVNSQAEVGETITYVYTVTNSGNVALTNVAIQDTHEGALLSPSPANETFSTENGFTGDSSDGTADDGVWDTLGQGDVITFTYTHTVTQAEVDGQ